VNDERSLSKNDMTSHNESMNQENMRTKRSGRQYKFLYREFSGISADNDCEKLFAIILENDVASTLHQQKNIIS
jgi:hypothetical protein